MKSRNFLIKLHKEGKIQIVEPSHDIARSYIMKSDSYISSAKILLEHKRLEECVSIAYYSMYYILTALLFKIGIKSENHTASIELLKEVIGLDNAEMYHAKKERIDKQYYVDFSVTIDEVKDMIKTAENFTQKVYDFMAKLKYEDTISYQKRLKTILEI
jgi:uncharacterized protein (UPF0332 family)